MRTDRDQRTAVGWGISRPKGTVATEQPPSEGEGEGEGAGIVIREDRQRFRRHLQQEPAEPAHRWGVRAKNIPDLRVEYWERGAAPLVLGRRLSATLLRAGRGTLRVLLRSLRSAGRGLKRPFIRTGGSKPAQ